VVECDLYVAAVSHEDDRLLLGARLGGLCGVPAAELASRLRRLRGCDNEYQVLAQLALTFADPAALADLLDRDAFPADAPLELLLPDGGLVTVALTWEAEAPRTMFSPPSTLTPPTLNAARLGWSFLDARGATAWLRVASLRHYRESFEFQRATGFQGLSTDRLAAIAREVPEGHLPATMEEQIAAVPSATELVRDLVAAMQEARTATLLVDLRECDGGNSFFATLLGYFLYGREALLLAEQGYQVRRYSPLYFANYQGETPEAMAAAVQNGGYDFADERSWLARQRDDPTPEALAQASAEFERGIARAPTFAREYARGAGPATWTPRVVVLTSAWTYSAGFDVAALLVRQGADIVGVPSAQAGNCFIDILRFHLDHSGLEGMLSFKWSLLFPDDAERGRVLRPARELTYADLVARQFDPQATIALALDHLRNERAPST
jgi:hypothetical protein